MTNISTKNNEELGHLEAQREKLTPDGRYSLVLRIVESLLVVIVGVLLAVAALFELSLRWALDTWRLLTIDEIIWQLSMPLQGAGGGITQGWALRCALPSGFVLIVWILLCRYIVRHVKVRFRQRECVVLCITAALSLAAMVFTLQSAWDAFGADIYYGNFSWATIREALSGNVLNAGTDASETSGDADVDDQETTTDDQSEETGDFVENHYVDPADVDITFPEQKRNLIYIYLESMEMTYTDKADGGAFDTDVIPELTALAQANEDFGGTSTLLNGAVSLPGTTWTVAGMFAQTSGLPLQIGIGGNSMSTQDTFFPTVVTLGDILEEQGYSQTLLLGSDASFGGRDLYFTEHGNYDIEDYYWARSNDYFSWWHKVWWGYEDKYLFEIAKDRLTELAAEGEPFNLTMLTVDTHFEDGYVCDLCQDDFGDNQYANVFACSSRQVAEFIAWVEQQDFYDNTTIIINGDHLTMDTDFCDDVAADYQRRTYTCYINSAAEVSDPEAVREYSTFDSFPTTLAALGATISGERLGLGTNLFSDTPTLSEELGYDTMKMKLAQHSSFVEKLSTIEIETGERLSADLQVTPEDDLATSYLIEVSDISSTDGTTTDISECTAEVSVVGSDDVLEVELISYDSTLSRNSTLEEVANRGVDWSGSFTVADVPGADSGDELQIKVYATASGGSKGDVKSLANLATTTVVLPGTKKAETKSPLE